MASPIRNWTPDRLMRLDGKTYVITGANSGIGFEAAKILAAKGGHVIMLCRDRTRAEAAHRQIEMAISGSGKVELVLMDLGLMASIREAADHVAARAAKIDGLILNAGIMAPPVRQETADGFEIQFGVNHLGHFLLAGLLSARVKAAQGRFVSVSSTMHKHGARRIRFEDLNWQTDYHPAQGYAQSKLANVFFIRELNKKLREAGRGEAGYLAHPGYAATALQTKETRGAVKGLMKIGNALTAQSAARGSWPSVLAAADSEARPGLYYGPTGPFELRGPVGECKLAPHAQDDKGAEKLWAMSEALVGHAWEF
jgi:NAD(P)-dependent dehydrogenase (short-subunit alcohol dehydrogenase family)